MLFLAEIILNEQNSLESNDTKQYGNVIANVQHGYDISATKGDALLALVLTGLELVENRLRLFADDPEFLAKIQKAFGENLNSDRLLELKQAWTNGDFSLIPQIKILSGSDLGGANAAFSVETNTIYLSQGFLERVGQNPEGLSGAFLEEIGHSVDQYLNNSDSSGDEGAIFSALVSGQNLTDSQLHLLYAEDDHGVVQIDGRDISVEMQDFTGDAGDNIINGTSDDDNIYGLDGNDTINPGLGFDYVDGGTGNDLLIIDYSSNTYTGTVNLFPGGIDSVIYGNNTAGFSGLYQAYKTDVILDISADFTDFTNIERFQITGTSSLSEK
jgi:Ca2+-binding RTX toxin-like protein